MVLKMGEIAPLLPQSKFVQSEAWPFPRHGCFVDNPSAYVRVHTWFIMQRSGGGHRAAPRRTGSGDHVVYALPDA
jgi:hypothetical protein